MPCETPLAAELGNISDESFDARSTERFGEHALLALSPTPSGAADAIMLPVPLNSGREWTSPLRSPFSSPALGNTGWGVTGSCCAWRESPTSHELSSASQAIAHRRSLGGMRGDRGGSDPECTLGSTVRAAGAPSLVLAGNAPNIPEDR